MSWPSVFDQAEGRVGTVSYVTSRASVLGRYRRSDYFYESTVIPADASGRIPWPRSTRAPCRGWSTGEDKSLPRSSARRPRVPSGRHVMKRSGRQEWSPGRLLDDVVVTQPEPSPRMPATPGTPEPRATLRHGRAASDASPNPAAARATTPRCIPGIAAVTATCPRTATSRA